MKKKFSILLMLCFTLLLGGCNNSPDVIVDDINVTSGTVTEESAEQIDTGDAIIETVGSNNIETDNEYEVENGTDNLVADWSQISLAGIPTYNGTSYITINSNEPFFSEEDRIRTDAFEYYSDLDELGRCGVAYANVCKELQPTEERGSIGHVKPSGWQTVKYNGYIEGNYLYNRCHLIGYQLAGENANELNLITGTRYMNCDGQLPFEDMVDDYVDDTGNHVLYRVTPIYEGDNLVASGVLTEAYSVEDNGEGLSFCVYCFNVQPGIGIDYATGNSWFLDDYEGEYATETYFSTKQIKNYIVDTEAYNMQNENTIEDVETVVEEKNYILNMNTMKFHEKDCKYANDISENNRKDVVASRDALLEEGYYPCGSCKP